MAFDPQRAEIRFGCGLSPGLAPPQSVDEMLARLSGPDHAALRFPVEPFAIVRARWDEWRAAMLQRRDGATEAIREEGLETRRRMSREFRGMQARWLGHTLLRRAFTEDGLRERLSFFWADHFTAAGKNTFMRTAYMPYIDEAVRPHVAGRFADLLKAVIRHPLMLHYLDQQQSAGPDSRAAARRKRNKGINENLARELLELHTLGVTGAYVQADVRELADLLTGLGYNFADGFRFSPGVAQPGTETILGRTYGADPPRLAHIDSFLEDLAQHPATAAHLARKLAVHFVADAPDPAMINAMADRYIETGGHLTEVYRAMLEHSAAWQGPGNVKQPIDFLGSSLRALEVTPQDLPTERLPAIRDWVLTPLALMGQEWGRPLGPDGWPEADPDWITPQRLAARVQWAMTVPSRLRRPLPDPRALVRVALGPEAPVSVRFAARAAENRPEGVGVILASPAFQRM